MRKDELPHPSRYRFPYPPLPTLSEGMEGYRVFTKERLVVYEGSDRDIARLLINSGRHQLVPVGETMETMP